PSASPSSRLPSSYSGKRAGAFLGARIDSSTSPSVTIFSTLSAQLPIRYHDGCARHLGGTRSRPWRRQTTRLLRWILSRLEPIRRQPAQPIRTPPSTRLAYRVAPFTSTSSHSNRHIRSRLRSPVSSSVERAPEVYYHRHEWILQPQQKSHPQQQVDR
ncbi:hypothetical protein CC86DRAFT_465469, partial [Ophiobolus disseminans]